MFKAEYAFDSGMPQWLAIANCAMSPMRWERLFLGRHKFHHFRTFYRDELAGYVPRNALDSRAKQRSYLNGAALESMVEAHTRGFRNYTIEIHKALSCELVRRLLIDNR